MITKSFTVHSAVADPVLVDVVVEEVPMQALVPGVVIELLAVDGSGSHTLRLVAQGADAEAILAEFTIGAAITATYTAG